MDALETANGDRASLLYSYALAQPRESGAPLGKAQVLGALLESYGVPGIKFAQYLGFSKQFERMHANFEIYQDEALPVSYQEVIELLEKQFGSKWDSLNLKVVGLKGSGSVNLAIEVVDKRAGETRVLQVKRSGIVQKSREDFRRLLDFLQALKNIQHKRAGKFDFVVGLGGIVRESVEVEFNRQNAFDVQTQAKSLYRRQIGNWTVQTVPPTRLKELRY